MGPSGEAESRSSSYETAELWDIEVQLQFRSTEERVILGWRGLRTLSWDPHGTCETGGSRYYSQIQTRGTASRPVLVIF